MPKNNRLKLALACCLALIPISLLAQVSLVFRYDDYAGDPPGARESDAFRMEVWKAEEGADSLFAKYGMKYAVAVIPNAADRYYGAGLATDPEKVELLRRGIREGRIEIAQHGYSHMDYSAKNHRTAEFRERTYDQQLRDIREGKDILTASLGIDRVPVFVPPFNAWDGNTIKALSASGFEVLSADRYQPAYGADISIVPFTAQLWDLERLLRDSSMPKAGTMIVLYHPPQIVKMNERYFGLERLDGLLKRIKEDPGIKVVSFGDLLRSGIDSSSARYDLSAEAWASDSFFFGSGSRLGISKADDQLSYLEKEGYRSELRKWGALRAAAYAVSLIVGALLGLLCIRILRGRLLKALVAASGAALIAAIGLALEIRARGFNETAIRLFPLLVIAGFFAFSLASLIARPSAGAARDAG
jgi:peptidoglycan/xylan/chitin deacetylase (PgdA/CDA1 family)